MSHLSESDPTMRSLFRALDLGEPIPDIPEDVLLRAIDRANFLLRQSKVKFAEIRGDLETLDPENVETIEMVKREKREASLEVEERIARRFALQTALHVVKARKETPEYLLQNLEGLEKKVVNP